MVGWPIRPDSHGGMAYQARQSWWDGLAGQMAIGWSSRPDGHVG